MMICDMCASFYEEAEAQRVGPYAEVEDEQGSSEEELPDPDPPRSRQSVLPVVSFDCSADLAGESDDVDHEDSDHSVEEDLPPDDDDSDADLQLSPSPAKENNLSGGTETG